MENQRKELDLKGEKEKGRGKKSVKAVSSLETVKLTKT